MILFLDPYLEVKCVSQQLLNSSVTGKGQVLQSSLIDIIHR